MRGWRGRGGGSGGGIYSQANLLRGQPNSPLRGPVSSRLDQLVANSGRLE